MNMNTENNSFSSNSFLEEVPGKKARKELFMLMLEDKLAADDEKSFPQWKILLYTLHEVNSKKNIIEHFLMPSFATCFFEKTLAKAVKSILKCEDLVNKEFNQVLDAILVQTLLIWSKSMHNCPLVLWNIVYEEILTLDSPYYMIKESMLDLESPLETSAEHIAWLQTLKKGDIVDCVKTVDLDQFSLKVWSHAEVVSVNEKSIEVLFYKDGEKPQEISKPASCHEIAPYKTKCDDFEWRMCLQAGDIINACDKWRRWNNAIVVETRENIREEKEVLVGFRLYSEDGNQIDSKGRKYVGLSENDDEWFNATSPYIAQKNSMTKTSTFDTDENSLNDSQDLIFKPSSPEKTVYAVYAKDRCESITFINIINRFGEQGGFENISRTLLDKTNPISTDNGQRFCKNLSNLNQALHRTFVREYASKLQDFWVPEIERPGSDKYIDILNYFLRRVYPSYRLKEIEESYKPSQPPKRPELDQMNKIELIDYLEQNGLPQEYLENHEKRNKLFYIDVKNRKLTMEQVARLWVATKPNNKGRINSMCEDILKVYCSYSNPERAFLTSLIDHLFETKPEDIAERSLEMIIKIFSSATTVPEGYYQKFHNFLQRSVYINLERLSYSLIKSLNSLFARLSNDFLSTDEIIQILYKYTDNVAQHVLVLPSLNLIGAFSAFKPKADKKFNQESYIQHLCEEKNLLDLVLQDFRFSKQQLVAKTLGQTITVQLLESLLPMNVRYIEDYVSGMTGTITFIHTRCPANRSKLDILREIWDITIKNPLIPKEKETLIQKIRDIMVSEEGPRMNEDDLRFLMKELNYIQSPSDLSLEAYECYLHLFVTLHEKLQNIYDVMFVAPDPQLIAFYGEYRYDKFVRDSSLTGEQFFEFKVRVSPEKLEGFDQIWRFMLFSENDQVIERAIDFNAMVYSNIENEFRNNGELLWKGFLTSVKRYLNEILETKESVSKELLNKRISNCLKSIIRMLYRTEKSIPRELQPHWKLKNRGNIKVWFYGMNRVDKVQMSAEQTIRDLLDEYEKKKGAKVDNQAVVRDNLIHPYHKRYLPLYEAAVKSGVTYIEDRRPVLGFLLANSREKLDPRAEAIFIKWFDEFSTHEKMNPDQFGMFLQSIQRDSSLVKDSFETYDTDRDGFLTLKNFLSYYLASCVKRPLEVWRDIVTRGEMYGSKFYEFDQFGKVKEAGEPKPEISPSLRSYMGLDKELFALLSSILSLEGPGIDQVNWLLQRLPTNPKMLSDIVTLTGVRGVDEPNKRDWEQVFTSKSPTAFLYALDIIDYLFNSNMEDDSPDETRESTSGRSDIWTQSPDLLEYKKTWCQDFIELGGSKHLSEAIETVKKHPLLAKKEDVQERMEKTTQKILTFLCFYTEDPRVKNNL